MPTYYCHIPQNSISDIQKNKLARAITDRHHEATGAPKFFVQVVLEDDRDTHKIRYLGGAPAENHIWVRADIRAGRTKAQLQKLMSNIINDISNITGISESEIWIYLNNIEPDNMMEYGHVLPIPGEEQEWFDALPEPLQERLKLLGVNNNNFIL